MIAKKPSAPLHDYYFFIINHYRNEINNQYFYPQIKSRRPVNPRLWQKYQLFVLNAIYRVFDCVFNVYVELRTTSSGVRQTFFAAFGFCLFFNIETRIDIAFSPMV